MELCQTKQILNRMEKKTNLESFMIKVTNFKNIKLKKNG